MPQDDKLRAMATRQLLVDGNTALARQMFAAIAYDAHSKVEVRQKNQRIMEAIVAGNAAVALSLLDEKKKEEDDNS
jgi:hypothetical protein